MPPPLPMPTVALPSGQSVPALGLGTWHMGERSSEAPREVAAIRHAIELGYRLFDTAEMYGEGGAETLLGQALGEALRVGAVRREELVIVSKVYPHNAGRRGVPAACERSLRRLGLDRIDIYLLHWRGAVPLAETVEAFEALCERGLIGAWGVSNFDVDDLDELVGEAAAARSCALNQVLYALDERGPEFALQPRQRALAMPLMAYCPLGQGSLARDPLLQRLAAARGDEGGCTAAQLALAWTLREGDVIAIPKAVDHRHLADNLAAAALRLDAAELAALDAAFPPPRRKKPLAMV